MTASRRILYIEANEDGTVGGSHQALYDFVRHVDRGRVEPVLLFYQRNRFADALREEGFEVHLYEAERERERAIRSRGGAGKRLDVLGAILRRHRFLGRHRIDAVHINNSPKVGNDDWLPAARLRGIPILANAMGDARGASGRVHRWLFRRFDHVLPISAYMTDAMVRQGIPLERMTSIRLGVDLDRIRARVRRSRAEVRSEFGLREDQVLLAMVGNIREWKGQHVLLEALARLDPHKRRRLHAVFAGAVDAKSADYEARLQGIVEANGLAEQVSWLGARSDVPDLFAAADVAVHCSTLPEPFGLVVTEALGLGTPVAATNAGGPAEVITDACGWLYPPGDADRLATILAAIEADPDMVDRKAEGALARANEYSVQRTVERSMDAYAAVFEAA